MKTVKEISEITGLSIRTLRYYDKIGLLNPAQLSDARYRLYDSNSLLRLQEIMFFRELEFSLSEIKEILENSGYDKKQAMAAQKCLLVKKRNRLDGIIRLITDVMEGDNTLDFKAFQEEDVKNIIRVLEKELTKEQLDKLMSQNDCHDIENYEKLLGDALKDENTAYQLIKWYGSRKKTVSGVTPIRNLEDLQKENDSIYRKLAGLMISPDAKVIRTLVSELEEVYKSMFHLDNARFLLLDMAKEYLKNGPLAAATDVQYGAGSAEFIALSIRDYYGV